MEGNGTKMVFAGILLRRNMNNIFAGDKNFKRRILFFTTISMKIAGIGFLESEEYAYTKKIVKLPHHDRKNGRKGTSTHV